MQRTDRPPWASLWQVLAACIVAGAAAITPAAAQTSTPTPDGVTPHINAVRYNPAGVQRIKDWGLTPADVQHDVDALPPAERARLAYLLTRRWPSDKGYHETDLQAQFLVMMSLMRESQLFASVISTSPARLLQ